MKREGALRCLTRLLTAMAAASLWVSVACATVPAACRADAQWGPGMQRAPPSVDAYLNSLGEAVFDQRLACRSWAAAFSHRNRILLQNGAAGSQSPPRFILFPGYGYDTRSLSAWLLRSGQVRNTESVRNFTVASFHHRISARQLRELLDAPQIEYYEPDCDGPDFLATSAVINIPTGHDMNCWLRAARSTFPNDPCMDELWGHRKIDWDSGIAARSLPRIVAILDSGIDASHEDLASNVMLHALYLKPVHSQGRQLNELCATSGQCYPHGTQMAGTIGGRMDNGIGVAGVAPNSRLLSIVISQVDNGHLARLSTIAEGIEAAASNGADIINISAKWPVDSRAISEAIGRAVSGPGKRRRLLVTGYATSLDLDESVREYFPSQYRCMPGVLAAVPTDMRGHALSNPKGRPDAGDGRIQAPGVDIVVTTTENSERGYALSEAAGASSAAAYVSGALALVWGSPPLNKCDAQQIKQLLFCRSKSSDSTRYPWINVEFLRELQNVDAGADCRTAMQALACP
jgi:hypothetical protein